jgi:hypothetical protein
VRGRYLAVLFGFLLVFIGYMDRINIGVAAIQITKIFNLNTAQIGAISTVFFMDIQYYKYQGDLV